MKILDLTIWRMCILPVGSGTRGNQMYYAQRLQTKMIVAQRIDMALYVAVPGCRARAKSTSASAVH